jgi:hypothetical protein
MEQIPSSDVYSRLITLEISRLLWNPKIYYYVRKNSPLNLTLSQLNSVKILASWVRSPLKYFRICEFLFFGQGSFAPYTTPKTEYHPLSALRDCLFSILVAILHISMPCS